MTDQELKDLVASLAIAQRETNLGIRELRESQAQTDKQLRESQQQTDRQLRELGKQIGGLGNKFGGFTEGLFYPSLKKLLLKRFGMEKIFPNVTSETAGLMELDILGYTNTSVNEVYVVETKSYLKEEGILQFEKTLLRFFASFPEHRGKKLFGLLAFVQGGETIIELARRKGFYLVRVKDEIAELLFDEDFKPKDFFSEFDF